MHSQHFSFYPKRVQNINNLDLSGSKLDTENLAIGLQLAEISKTEEEESHRCKARLEHLSQLGVPAKDHVLDWNRKRLDRILVDYMLRSGYHNTALQLTEEGNLQVCYLSWGN